MDLRLSSNSENLVAWQDYVCVGSITRMRSQRTIWLRAEEFNFRALTLLHL